MTVLFVSSKALAGVVTMDVRKAKKGRHAEPVEARAVGIANYALAVMHGVKAFTHHASTGSA